MSQLEFVPGQRWVSSTEAELGLGIVESCANRRVEIYFPAADEARTYAVNNAPLSRVLFVAGDKVEVESGETVVWMLSFIAPNSSRLFSQPVSS